ncbi:SusC/RagA family TonB-linked outer membrane protein [Porphyromonas sp.]|uniref:SusC/RagA family TonB-linked outer membrane protein n=1 Tax=Porphyromonas sp. TaxID=1924944 RepID=UPI0026DC08EE|nr:SusC/RagA family TonB-linked outer membrane protein [Porphyromonas sp.]MDO4771365.1 SusC/RagA family TonB-linked outer membrane protein [Porphyromonas sp.]
MTEKITRNSVFRKVVMGIVPLAIFLSASAQTIEKRLSLKCERCGVSEIVRELASLSGMSITDPEGFLPEGATASVDFSDKKLSDALAELLASHGLTFRHEGKQLIIMRENTVVLRGKVSFTDKSPARGATIYIDGKPSAISGNDGAFECRIPKGRAVSVKVTFVGSLPVEKRHKGEGFLNIILHDDEQALDEVVITGFQTINKRNWTGSSTTLKAEDIITPGMVTIDKGLEGVVPGVISLPMTGELGAAPRLRIRGTSTILGSREPLWVVDGVVQRDPVTIPAEDLNDPDFINRIGNAIAGINPQDIERIDILKDAASTALYGAQAANGVIVVTTKKGAEGKLTVSYTGSVGLSKHPRYSDRNINLMNSLERVNFSRELIDANYYFPNDMYDVGYEHLVKKLYNKEMSYDEFTARVGRIESLNTDWFDLLMRDALSNSHHVSVSGTSGKISYYGSLGYDKSNGVVRHEQMDRGSAYLKLMAELSPKAKLSLWIRSTLENRAFNASGIQPTDYAYNTSRAIPAYDEEGGYSFYKKGSAERFNFNILNEMQHSGRTQESFNTSVNAALDVKLSDPLTFNSLVSVTASNTNGEEYWDEHTYKVADLRQTELGQPFDKVAANYTLLPYGGQLSTMQERYLSYSGRAMLSYVKAFADESVIRANIGTSISSIRSKGKSRLHRGYLKNYGGKFVSVEDIDRFEKFKAWLVSPEAQPKLKNDLFNQLSFFATLSYTWRNNLTLSLNARTDGSNRFGDRSNEKILPVWSLSGSYDLSELLPKNDVLNYLFVRSSFGLQGNMLSDQSPEPIIRRMDIDPYYNEPTARLERYPNPDLKWEKTRSFSAEVDMALFRNRLFMTLEYYRKVTRDAFHNIGIDLVNGYSSYVINSGVLKNSGYSLSLSAIPVKTNDFSWRVSTVFSKSLNSLDSRPEDSKFLVGNYLNGTALVQGRPLGTFYSYRFKGLNPEDGGPQFYDKEDEKEKLFGLSNHEVYSQVLTESGNRFPYMQGGLRNTIHYKRFSLRFSLAYSLGAKTRLFKLYGSGRNFQPEMNVNRVFIDRWRKTGDEMHTNIPAVIDQTIPAISDKYNRHYSLSHKQQMPVIANNAWEMYNFSDIRVVSADYLKCTDLSLSYMLPDGFSHRLGLSRVNLAFSTNNLFTISSKALKGQTPVQGGFTQINLSERPQYSFQLSFSL